VIEIALLNRSTVVADGTLDVITTALNHQLKNAFGPADAWGIEANLTFVPKGAPDPTNSWWVAVFDNADVANALGYHDVTSSGSPLGKVFAATDLYYGTALSVTVGHEVLEMLADPNIERSVQVGDQLYRQEVCDAVEGDEFAYPIDVGGEEVLCTDFVLPAWFQPNLAPGSTKFDFRNHCQRPLELLAGGYIQVKPATGGGWTSMTASGAPDWRSRGMVGSRRERAMLPRELWVPSSPVPPDRVAEIANRLITAARSAATG